MTTAHDGFIRTRCQREGCTAEVLLGYSRHETPVILDVHTERRAILQGVPLRNLAGETVGVGKRVVFHDTYTPHRFSCRGKFGQDAAANRAAVAIEREPVP